MFRCVQERQRNLIRKKGLLLVEERQRRLALLGGGRGGRDSLEAQERVLPFSQEAETEKAGKLRERGEGGETRRRRRIKWDRLIFVFSQ